VLLNTEELALVLANNDTAKGRPAVKIIGNADGLYDTAQWIDLATPDQAHREIVRLVEPDRYGLDIKDFVLRD
jgi:hypothetical protein